MFLATKPGNPEIADLESDYHRSTPYAQQKDIFILLFTGGQVLSQLFQIDNDKNRVLSFISQGCLETGNIKVATGK